MEAIVLSGYGQPPSLQVASRPVGEPRPGEVLVKVMASPINPSDQIFLRGANPNARPLPSVPGFEGSGIVIRSGGGALADSLVGKRTAFRARPDKDGAWAEATLAFDAIAGGEANQLLAAMPRGAELWSYGGLSEQPLKIDPMILIYEQKSLRGFWGPPTFYKLSGKEFEAASREIQERLDTIFSTTVQKTFPLTDFAIALSTYEHNMSNGKVLFLIDHA